MYKCKYFEIHELVPPKVYYHRRERAWELIDDRVLITLDRLRERFGRMTVNNYVWGGEREWSGLRTPDSPYFSPNSQHTFGRAMDCLFDDIKPHNIRAQMLGSPNDETFEYITAIEMNVGWLHFDVRNCPRITTFYP